MPLTLFSNGEPLTAAKLNALVDKLNQVEQIINIPAPRFQRVALDGGDYATENGLRWWRFAILHQTANRYLHYRYKWTVSSFPILRFYIGSDTTPINMPTPSGLTTASIDLLPYAIPAGNLYVVKIYAELNASNAFALEWLYEAPWV